MSINKILKMMAASGLAILLTGCATDYYTDDGSVSVGISSGYYYPYNYSSYYYPYYYYPYSYSSFYPFFYSYPYYNYFNYGHWNHEGHEHEEGHWGGGWGHGEGHWGGEHHH